MSQIAKKSASLPFRKRIRPTVNLNVAGRRRNNVKEAEGVASDGNPDVCKNVEESKINDSRDNASIQSYNKHSQNTKSVEQDSIKYCVSLESVLLDKPNESSVLIEDNKRENKSKLNDSIDSSASTVIIENNLPLNRKENESKLSNSFDSSVSTVIVENNFPIKKKNNVSKINNSFDSTASTVVVPLDESISEILGNLEHKSLEQSFDLDDAKSVSSSVSTVLINENYCRSSNDNSDKGDVTIIDLEADTGTAVNSSTSDLTLGDKELSISKNGVDKDCELKNNSVVLNDDTNSRTSSKYNGNRSNNSTLGRTSPITALENANTDVESLMEDDRSSVFSYSSGNDMLPHKYKRKSNSMTKRLAEAKKDFATRYVDKKPERSSLRMFDLIFYNPTTNPMKPTPATTQEVIFPSSGPEPNRSAEEEVDNPEEPEEDNEEENERVPAPRVKVGPNGEIVLDEQSLVIETTQSKKSRKEIANLTVVVDSGSSTTYHTYSKKKRRRCGWSIQETVRFYKALQSIGTDFSLMQSLFPSRTRVDLKAKFKKEERINGHLIEKALRFPSLFDLSELEKEQANENAVSKKANKKRGKKKCLGSLGFDEEDSGPPKKRSKPVKESVKTLSQRNRDNENNRKNLEKRNSDCSPSDEYHPPIERVSVEKDRTLNEEVVRSRPKRVADNKRPDYAAIENGHAFLEGGVEELNYSSDEVDDVPLEEISNEPIIDSDNVPNSPIPLENFSTENVQPGSIVLFTTECPDNPGYQICNVFMVQDNMAGFTQSNVSGNTNNCLSFSPSEINSAVIDLGGQTYPS